MNILFLTEKEAVPKIGGSFRITYTLAKGFEERGHNCFQLCGKDLFSYSTIEKCIVENHIDIIISNLVDKEYKFVVLPMVFEISRKTGSKVFACLHAMPGEELVGNTVRNSLYRIFRGEKTIENLKFLILGILPRKPLTLLFSNRLKKRYHILYDNSDKMVVLSDRFYDDIASLGKITIDNKFVVIHNALSFNCFLSEEKIPLKNKEVLILSRMDERSKRLSRALRIWKKVNEEGNHNDWRLTIIGDGRDLDYYKKIAKRLKLKNLSFEGRKENEISYYERSAIFMMTSAYEGWGITLTEAQQMGVVPIAFDSYSSLRDIIEDGKNGVTVKNNDFEEYAEKLLWLMDHEEARYKMAREAILSSHRYSLDVILDRWETTFAHAQGIS